MIRSLKLRDGQRTGLISIFALGAFVIAASIVRMVMLYASAGSTDPSWGSTVALSWTEIEANTSVIVCCMPALRVPFLNLWQNITGGKDSTTTTSSGRATHQTHDGAYSGPHGTSAMVAHPDEKLLRNHQLPENYGGSSFGVSEDMHASTLYDRVVTTLGTRKQYDASQASSQGGTARGDAGLIPRLEQGGIYKTTDVHITSQDVQLNPEKNVSFAQMMCSDK